MVYISDSAPQLNRFQFIRIYCFGLVNWWLATVFTCKRINKNIVTAKGTIISRVEGGIILGSREKERENGNEEREKDVTRYER